MQLQEAQQQQQGYMDDGVFGQPVYEADPTVGYQDSQEQYNEYSDTMQSSYDGGDTSGFFDYSTEMTASVDVDGDGDFVATFTETTEVAGGLTSGIFGSGDDSSGGIVSWLTS